MRQKLAGTEKHAIICNVAFEKKHQVRVPTSQQKHHFFKAASFPRIPKQNTPSKEHLHHTMMEIWWFHILLMTPYKNLACLNQLYTLLGVQTEEKKNSHHFCGFKKKWEGQFCVFCSNFLEAKQLSDQRSLHWFKPTIAEFKQNIISITNMFNQFTPPKINVEPENDGLEDDFPFPGVYSEVPC